MVMGRPRIEIDWIEFDKLCQMWATMTEIASWFECSVDTIDRRVQEKHGVTFAEYYKRHSDIGSVSLRRKQFQMALEGNVPLLMFLGKNLLGQSDKQELSVDVDNKSRPSIDQIIHMIKSETKYDEIDGKIVEVNQKEIEGECIKIES